MQAFSSSPVGWLRSSRVIGRSVSIRFRRSALRPVGDLALDLGTSNTQLFVRGAGIVVDQPTLVGIDSESAKVVAVGDVALDTARHEPGIALRRPLDKGVVCDPRLASAYLAEVFGPHTGGRMSRFSVVATIPANATAMERRVLREAAKRAGAHKVRLVEQTVAGAIGAGLAVHEPAASVVVSIGAGVTEAAIITLGCVVGSHSERVGGDDVDNAIKSTLRRDHDITVSDITAEQIKLNAAVASSVGNGAMLEARGVTLRGGTTATAIVEQAELEPAFATQREAIFEVIRAVLIQAGPELASDISLRGMTLVGGAALMPNLADAISTTFDLQASVADNAHAAVVEGAGRCLDAVEGLEAIFVAERS